MLRVHAQQASNGFWVVEEKRHNYYYGNEQKQSQSYFLHHESRLTMKSTHKIAQRNATGHASTNKRMSHSNAKIGFDAIVSVVPSEYAGHMNMQGSGGSHEYLCASNSLTQAAWCFQRTKTFHLFLLFLLKHAQNPLLVFLEPSSLPKIILLLSWIFCFILIPTAYHN